MEEIISTMEGYQGHLYTEVLYGTCSEYDNWITTTQNIVFMCLTNRLLYITTDILP